MKIVCVYHSIDLDGFMSAAIVKHWFKQEYKNDSYDCGKDFQMVENYDSRYAKLDFIGYNYGQSIPDLSEYGQVIMCDISFPKNHMESLQYKLGNNFIWIDHHISAINDNKIFIKDTDEEVILYKGLRDTKFAACELTWQYFFPNEQMPEIVRLLGRYDCFGHKGTDEEIKVLEFQYGARAYIKNYEDAYSFLIEELSETESSIVNRLHLEGISIYQYLCTEAKQSYKNGFEISLIYNPQIEQGTGEYVKFICINKERFNPINFGIDYHKDGYDGVASFHYDGKTNLWKFSLYNDNGDVDCSIIAKQFGGGGHKGAAGFVVKI